MKWKSKQYLFPLPFTGSNSFQIVDSVNVAQLELARGIVSISRTILYHNFIENNRLQNEQIKSTQMTDNSITWSMEMTESQGPFYYCTTSSRYYRMTKIIVNSKLYMIQENYLSGFCGSKISWP